MDIDNNADNAKEIANNVLHFYGHGGYPAGSFTASLLKTISLADMSNMVRLATVFPVEVAIMSTAMSDVNGINTITEIANS